MQFRQISQLIKAYKITPNKNFGQNFLINSTIPKKIVEISNILPEDEILEVGPGLGSLTAFILGKEFKSLTLLEKDVRFIDILQNEYINKVSKNVNIVQGDALKFEASSCKFTKILANLPYNIGTELLIKWATCASAPQFMAVMLQKEVIERILAKPKTKAYGRLSIIMQSLYDCKKEFDVSAGSFYPPPNVTSSVASFNKKPNIDFDVLRLSFITEKMFSNRRKILKNALNEIGIKKEEFEQKRAEELSVEEYILLAKI